MSFIDNLRNTLRGLNIDVNNGSSHYDSEIVPKQLKIMDKVNTNQFPAGWTKRTYDIVTPEYDDDGNEVGYGMGENDRLSFYYDEDGELAGAETPIQSYDFTTMGRNEALKIQSDLLENYSRGGRFGTLLMDGRSVVNNGPMIMRS